MKTYIRKSTSVATVVQAEDTLSAWIAPGMKMTFDTKEIRTVLEEHIEAMLPNSIYDFPPGYDFFLIVIKGVRIAKITDVKNL